MSLVEQAAKRLEQLRKAATEASSEAAAPASARDGAGSTDNASTIERMVRRMEVAPGETAQAAQPTAERRAADMAADQLPLPRHAAADTPSLRADLGDSADQEMRREPVLGALADVQDTEARDDARRSRRIAIDLKRVAAAGVLTPDAVESRLANELRVIKRPIVNNCIGKSASRVVHANRVMITSSSPGEGKSFLSANLAMSIAMERDSTVLLIEADTARPSLSTLLGLPPTPGLLDLLANPGMDVATALIRTDVPKLAFLPAGTRQQHSNELLASEVMQRLVDELASRYPDRILIFDSPPLLFSPEARVLARYVGQVVVVVEAEKTTHGMLTQALSMVEDCPVVLLALNKATSPEEKGYYYYTG
ncbi:MAG: XrtA-associated tyrosine autokinase [Burkholderiales bacterium]|nr:XrtA-associated tyrosine autokinase [Burkholderiales bacterium]